VHFHDFKNTNTKGFPIILNMYASTTALTLTTLLGLTLAVPLTAPLTTRDHYLVRNTQSCSVLDEFNYNYIITIAVPFNHGDECKAVYNELDFRINEAMPDDNPGFEEWSCISANDNDQVNGAVALNFWLSYPGFGDVINKALSKKFPSVNGFNCPDA
jgi:hypothetical protein